MNDLSANENLGNGEGPQQPTGFKMRCSAFWQKHGPALKRVGTPILGITLAAAAYFLNNRDSPDPDTDSRASVEKPEEPSLYGIPESEIAEIAKETPRGTGAKVEGQQVTLSYTSNSKKTRYQPYIYTTEEGVEGVNRGLGPRENISTTPLIFASKLDARIKQAKDG